MATINSVVGNVNQTPIIPPMEESKKAIGIITINPRSREIICAGRACSVDVK